MTATWQAAWMDPTLAALIGAGIGALVTAISPWMTGRIQHRSRRREVMREAYLQGMRAVATVGRLGTVEECDQANKALWEAQLHIRLAGSRRTSELFNELNVAAGAYIDAVIEYFETRRKRELIDLQNNSTNWTSRTRNSSHPRVAIWAWKTRSTVGHCDAYAAAPHMPIFTLKLTDQITKAESRLHASDSGSLPGPMSGRREAERAIETL